MERETAMAVLNRDMSDSDVAIKESVDEAVDSGVAEEAVEEAVRITTSKDVTKKLIWPTKKTEYFHIHI